MNTFLDSRNVGFCANFKLILNCLSIDPNIDNWFFSIQNSLYGEGNIWEKFITQNTYSENLIEWDQKNNYINFLKDNIQQSINWVLGYNSDERDKYENVEFINHFRELIKQIQFKEEILNEVEKYNHLINYNTVGVHIRMRDHLHNGHGSGQKHNLDLQNLVHKLRHSGKEVFIVSDTYEAYNFFSNQIENIKFLDAKKQYDNDKVGLHFLPLSINDKEQMLKTLLVEIILLSKCSHLYLMNSNVSHIALFLANHFNFEFYDKNIIYN